MWGRGYLHRIVLPILISISLVLGVSVAYSILYIYPYSRGAPPQIQENATAQATTVIPEILPSAYSAESGIGNLSTTPTTPLAHAIAGGLRGPSSPGAGAPSAEISNISISGGKIYLRIRLTMVGGLPTAGNISIVRIALTPAPFPYGWNGSSWVYGSEETRCILRVPMPLKILSYSYRITYEGNESALIDIELDVDRRINIYGPYNMSLVVKKGSLYINIAREIPLGGYRDPPGSPPLEIRERASTCG